MSPNTLQLLEDFTNELTGNPSPPPPPASNTLTSPLQTTEVEHTPDIVEQLGGGDNIQEGEGDTTLPDFQLTNRILNAIVVYTATFGDPFNSLMGGKFVFDPVEIVHAYVDKIRALLENQIQLWGGRDSIKVSIVLKVFYLNEGKSEVYHHYIHSEMRLVYSNLENFEGAFMDWVGQIITHLENFNENGSGSLVLFVENLSVNICKFKKDFILRGGG